MNAGILVLQDGSPCLVYDTPLPGEVVHVGFNYIDFLVSIVCEVPPTESRGGRLNAQPRTGIQKVSKIATKKGNTTNVIKLEYPLDPSFVRLLEEKKQILVGTVTDGKPDKMKVVPVVFSGT